METESHYRHVALILRLQKLIFGYLGQASCSILESNADKRNKYGTMYEENFLVLLTVLRLFVPFYIYPTLYPLSSITCLKN
jgi:hypothetical protein